MKLIKWCMLSFFPLFFVFTTFLVILLFICDSVLMSPLISKFSTFQLVFSSSATVYGWPKEVPCTEEFPLCATNPYGRTKVCLGNEQRQYFLFRHTKETDVGLHIKE